jgi:crotonobetaine/carnitine-CoA ligase
MDDRVSGGPLALPALVDAIASSSPQREYLVEVGGASRSYAEVSVGARRWSAAYADLGVSAGDTVAVWLSPSVRNVESWLGLGWRGAIEVPINTAYKGRLLEHVLGNSGASVLVAQPRWLERLRDIRHEIRTVVVVGDLEQAPALPGVSLVGADELLGAAEDRGVRTPEPWDTASIIYTSGTTGASKGVMMTWAQLHATATGTPDPHALGDHPRWYSPFPMFHVSGKQPLAAMALVEGTVVIREVFSTDQFWDDITTHRCDTGVLVSAMANFLLRRPDAAPAAGSTLKNVLMLPLIPEVEEFERTFGVAVHTCFNMSELSIPIRTDGPNRVDDTSCGRARDGYRLRIVDEHDREVPNGTVGELVVRADEPWSLMAGYWRMPEQTVHAWRNLWFHTGDAFRRDDDGNFFFVDRIKDAIRRRGENVSSVEVEHVVNDHPAVLECAVVGLPAEDGEQEVLAAVVPRPGIGVDPADLVAFCARHLPRFMVPRYVDVVDDLPKTPTGKIQKDHLRTAEPAVTRFDRVLHGIVLHPD